MDDIFESAIQQLEESGMTLERVTAALDSKDRWGELVHATEYLITLSTFVSAWKKYKNENE